MIIRFALALLSLPVVAFTAEPTTPKTQAFFPFCIDWHDAKKRNFDEQAAMLKEIGYTGVGHIWLDGLPDRIRSLDSTGLKLYQVTIMVDIVPGKQSYDPRLTQYMPLLRGRKTQLLLLMNGMKPSDPAGDERALVIVKELSDLARTNGGEVLLYPHSDFWLETIQDCVRLVKLVKRENVGVMFNLCHWLRVSPDRDYLPQLKAAMPWLRAVSINGADVSDPEKGWDHYIQPLGRGTFDTCKLLGDLAALGYKGPVGLQCYGIKGDAREHLAESMRAWNACTAEKTSPAPVKKASAN